MKMREKHVENDSIFWRFFLQKEENVAYTTIHQVQSGQCERHGLFFTGGLCYTWQSGECMWHMLKFYIAEDV